MITNNETGKVPKLSIEVPENEINESFPPVFAGRFNLGRLSPFARTPKARTRTETSSISKSFSVTPKIMKKSHKVPLVFIINSNNLKEKGAIDTTAETEDYSKSERFSLIYKDHLYQTYKSLRLVRDLRPVDIQQLRSKRVTLARRRGYEYKKTVIFDLDETLVHCCDDNSADATVVLPVRTPNGESIDVSICVRPFAVECLRQVSQNYEVIIFTASYQYYADAILDYLDPEHDMIHHRFYRQHCILMDGFYIKDLRIFANRKIKDMIIVDNLAHSFAYQIDNGVPIISWVDYEHDIELHGLIYYLNRLVKVDDIREANKETFRLRDFVEEFNRETNKSVVINSDID
jgi:Dullard-like phosphatase family protein